MNFKAFSIYDSKAEAYNTPIFVSAKGIAVRAFADQVNDPNSPMNRHAGDYTLFFIGEFNDDKGTFESTKTPESFGTGLEYLKGE